MVLCHQRRGVCNIGYLPIRVCGFLDRENSRVSTVLRLQLLCCFGACEQGICCVHWDWSWGWLERVIFSGEDVAWEIHHGLFCCAIQMLNLSLAVGIGGYRGTEVVCLLVPLGLLRANFEGLDCGGEGGYHIC